MTKSTRTKQSAGAERRRAPRYPCRLEVTCDLGGPAGAALTGRIVDIATGGIGLMLDRRLPVGATSTVRLRAGGIARDLEVRIVHAAELAPGCWLVGCVFLDTLGEDDLRALLS